MSHTWIGGDGVEYPWEDDYGVRELVGGTGLEGVPVASSTASLLGDGELRVRSRRPGAPVLVPLLFFDFDVMADMARSLMRTAEDDAPLGSIRDDDSGRSLTRVLYIGGLEGDSGRDATGQMWRRRVLELRALDPYWYGDERPVTLPVTKETLFADTATLFSAAIPFDGGGAEVLPITGDVAPDGVVRLTGPIDRYTFGTTAGAWTLSRAVAGGEVIEVDTRVASKGPRVGSSGRIEWGLLNPSSTLHRVPVSGAVIVGATSTAGAVATFTYRPRYLTPTP